VIDSFSTDRTIEIAQAAGARVVQRAFDSFAGQRNFALQNVRFNHDWVLHLDADEVCTEPLRQEIQQAIFEPQFYAYRIPSKTIFLGQWLRFSGMYPCYQVRLGRHPVFRFKQVGHGQREDITPARVGTLKEPYLHYSFSKGFEDWFAKHNRYSSDEALDFIENCQGENLDWSSLLSFRDQTRRRRALKDLASHLPCRPICRFLYMYVLRMGFLDGRAGLKYCRMMAMYEAMIDLKVEELWRRRAGMSL
jgi:glycosyltransferase involved in cell wall biosynthesis